jgi:flagellar hook-length control protein FliK
MLTTRAIAANRPAAEAARRGAAAAPQGGGDGSFVAALGAAGEGSDRPPDGAAATAQDRGSGGGLADAASTASPPKHGAATRRLPPGAAGDLAALPAALDPNAKPGAARDAAGTDPAAPERRVREERHRRDPPPLAAGAMLPAMVFASPAGPVGAPAPPAAGVTLSDRPPPMPDPPMPDPPDRGGTLQGAAAHPDLDGPRPADGAAARMPDGDPAAAATVLVAATDATGLPDAALAGAPADTSGRSSAAAPRLAAPGPLPAAATIAAAAVRPVAAIATVALSAERAAARSAGAGSPGAGAALAGIGAAAATPATAATPAGAAPAALAEGGAAGLAQQVAHRLAGMLAPGRLEVVLRLHPPELGELNVRVQVSGHEVSAWFDSPLPQVQQALSQAMAQLHAGLLNAGYSLNNAWVGGDAWTPRGWAAPPTRRPAPPPYGSVATAESGAPAAAGSGVSLYV